MLSRDREDKSNGRGNGTKDRRWHAVSIKPGKGCCQAARARRGQRWLSGEAPRLPLAGCNRDGGCSCIYQHHDDRRTGEGRRAEETGEFRVFHLPPVDRRALPDRRCRAGD